MKGEYINSCEICLFKKVVFQFYFYKNLISILPEVEIAWSRKQDKNLSFKFIVSFEWFVGGIWIKILK